MSRTDEAPLNDREAAAVLGVSVDLLRRWRLEGRGPRYVKYGPPGGKTPVRYRPADLHDWLDRQTVTPAS